MSNPLAGFEVDPAAIELVGRDLQRPECILAEPDGTLWSADARGGVMRIDPDGSQELIAQSAAQADGGADADSVERYILEGTLPNGLAFAPNGDFVIANFGTDAVELMTRDGDTRTLFTEIDGEPIGKANFVLSDSRGRIWLTVTTRLQPWTRSINEKAPDGYVAVIDDDGVRIVADGFIGTNEIRFDAAEEWLYVVESNGRCISRLRAHDDGSLTDREVYGPDDLGGIPDGFAFDSYGNLWITFVNADRLVALTPERELLTLLDAGNREGAEEFDRHFFAGTVTPEILGRGRGTLAPLMASVTFGGPDLSTVYLGSLMGTTIPSFRSPVAGLPLSHWR
ncbi:MAG TPA: SMP-30/gluconolactonase/LRE family protein [Thermoleophilaceae bacterium]|jgi:sugar lactone lactonase YvrE